MEEIDYTLHELYLDNLSRGFLHYEGKISPGRYFAVLDNAIKIKQFDWAHAFIEKYKHEIIKRFIFVFYNKKLCY